MSYSLRGRLETRLAAALVPLLAACVLAAAVAEWWPLALAATMVGAGVALDVLVYHPLLRYQAGWLALPLGLLELGVVIAAARGLDIAAPLAEAVAFYAGSWVLTQLLVHAVFPLRRLSYAEDGGELGRAGLLLVAGVAGTLAVAGGAAWSTLPPTVTLEAGVHQGPLVLDRAQQLVGEDGAVVRGGIRITADDVTVRNVRVEGGENGIDVDGAKGVLLDDVTVVGARTDGIHARRSSIEVRDCRVVSTGAFAQGIDVSFAFDRPPSLIDGCTVLGGYEGIVSHFTHIRVRDNFVRGTRLRAITLTEMSMGRADGNTVEDSLGVGIFCGDYSMCTIEDNAVAGTRADRSTDDRTRAGYAVQVQFGAKAIVRRNHLARNARSLGVFFRAELVEELPEPH